MDYQEALKQINVKKDVKNYLVVKITYDKEFIFPYKDGIAFIASMSEAEELHKPYGIPPKINALSMDVLSITPMSRKEYERIKIAELLKVSVDSIIELEKTQ